MRSRPLSTRLLSTVVIPALLLTAGISVVEAQNLIERRPRYEREAEGARISLDQAVNMAQSRYRAKAVKAQSINQGDRLVYQIRLLSSDGKVWTVQVDAQTGQMY